MATKEELQAQFDKVYTHLMKQGERSISVLTNAVCAYRGVDGKMCAAGACIPDDDYRNDMEGMTWDDVVVVYPKLESVLDISLGCELQEVHDSYWPDDWPQKLSGVAEKFGLTVPTIEPNQG